MNVRKSGEQILETSTLLNLRGDDLSEVIELFQTARQQLNGINDKEETEDNSSILSLIKDNLPERECPECGSEMILRTAKNGKNPGRKFYGCSHFPMCKVTLPC